MVDTTRAAELRLVGGKATVEAAGGRVGGMVGPGAFTMGFDSTEAAKPAIDALRSMGFAVAAWQHLTNDEWAARPVYLVRVPT